VRAYYQKVANALMKGDGKTSAVFKDGEWIYSPEGKSLIRYCPDFDELDELRKERDLPNDKLLRDDKIKNVLNKCFSKRPVKLHKKKLLQTCRTSVQHLVNLSNKTIRKYQSEYRKC